MLRGVTARVRSWVRLSPVSSKHVAVLAGVTTVVAGALGFLLTPTGFVGNLLAETAGVAISVAIALALVDRISTAERNRRWAQVGAHTERAIKQRILNIAWAYYLYAQMSLDEMDEEFMYRTSLDQPETTTAKAITDLSVANRKLLRPRATATDSTESPEALHRDVAQDLAHITGVLTPRVIDLASDPELAELLLRLEGHHDEWRGWMVTAEGWGAPDKFAWREATCCLEIGAAIFERLAAPGLTFGGPLPEDDWETLPH